MNYKNSKILLTIYLEGGTLSRKSNSATKQQIKALNYSDPKNKVSARHYANYTVNDCRKITTLSEVCVNDMISEKKPFWLHSKTVNQWKKMDDLDKIKIHCEAIANGRPFKVSLIEN